MWTYAQTIIVRSLLKCNFFAVCLPFFWPRVHSLNIEMGYISIAPGNCSIVSQPSKCLKFMTFQEGGFVIHVECKYLNEALETFYHH